MNDEVRRGGLISGEVPRGSEIVVGRVIETRVLSLACEYQHNEIEGTQIRLTRKNWKLTPCTLPHAGISWKDDEMRV